MPERNQENDPIFPKTELEKAKQPQKLRDLLLNFYYRSIPLFNINLAWFMLSMPVVTIFPALGGLYHAVLVLNREESADWGVVWEGFKTHWQMSLKWGLVVSVVNILLAANIWFYLNIEQAWGIYALAVTVVFLLIWITINQFSFPLLLLQEDKKIILAIRNGYVVAMRRPIEAIKVLVLSFLITVVSLLLPPLWIFLSMGVIAQIRTKSVVQAIKLIREEDTDRDAARKHSEGFEDNGEMNAVDNQSDPDD